MIYIGIDPGLDGAIAVLWDAIVGGMAQRIFDTPSFTVKGKTNKRHFDVPEMRNILVQSTTTNGKIWGMETEGISAHVFIEAVTPMPSIGKGPRRGMGATSAFSFGRGVGLWEGLLVGLGIPYTRVHPARWKKAMMDGEPKDKGASILVAKRLFPGVELNRKRDHGKADAILIAEFGRRTQVTEL